MKILNRYTARDTQDYSHDFEVNSGEICAEPSLTLSVGEILRRYSVGAPLPDSVTDRRYQVYNNGHLFPHQVKGFDLADLPKAQQSNFGKIRELEQQLNELKKASEAKQTESSEVADQAKDLS